MLDEDPLLRIEGALREASELEARRGEHRAGQDHQVREISQLHQSLMESIGETDGVGRMTDHSLGDLVAILDRILRDQEP